MGLCREGSSVQIREHASSFSYLMNAVQILIKVAMISYCFFFQESLKICSGSNLLFCGLTFDFF